MKTTQVRFLLSLIPIYLLYRNERYHLEDMLGGPLSDQSVKQMIDHILIRVHEGELTTRSELLEAIR